MSDQIACALVATWQEWKQNILEQADKPTVAVPRTPIIHDDGW